MGFFDKIKAATTGICSVCGKEDIHIGKDAFVCNDCQKRMRAKGFIYYAELETGKTPAPQTVVEYAKNRDAILEKYRKPQLVPGTTPMDIVERTLRDGFGFVTTGYFAAAYGEYEGVVVDMADVYAVGYDEIFDKKLQVKGQSTYSFVILTRDAYVPYLGQAEYIAQKGFFSKLDQESLQVQIDKFTSICPNLKYPVMPIKELKKAMKSNGELTGNAEKYLANAINASGVCDYKFIVGEDSGAENGLPSKEFNNWMNGYGYYDLVDSAKLLNRRG